MTLSGAALLFISLVAVLLPTTSAYPNGAPSTVCASMYPGHNITAQTSVAPYSVIVNSTCYTPEKPITVTLRSTGINTTFTGFLMQARKPNDNSTSYGTFSAAGNTQVKPLSCFGLTNNAITHNSNPHINQTSFTWTPPTTLTGNIVLTTTVVEEEYEFWVQAVTLTLPTCSSSPNASSSRSLASGAFSLTTLLTVSILSEVVSLSAL